MCALARSVMVQIRGGKTLKDLQEGQGDLFGFVLLQKRKTKGNHCNIVCLHVLR